MATAEQVLAFARNELGAAEFPEGSHTVKYNTWYYGHAVSGNDYSWCMVFVQWCFAQAGASGLLPLQTASCGALMRAAKRTGLWVTRDFLPGDVVIYDFSGNKSVTEHAGIVERVTGYGVVAIEGNTSPAGSQSNGGEVCRKTRARRLIIGAVRPNYQEEEKKTEPLPAPACGEGVEWARKNGILPGGARGDSTLSQPVTWQQLCAALYRFAKLTGRD